MRPSGEQQDSQGAETILAKVINESSERANSERPLWLQQLMQSRLFKILLASTVLFWGKQPNEAQAAPTPNQPDKGAVAVRDQSSLEERLEMSMEQIRLKLKEVRVSSAAELNGLGDQYGAEVYTRFYTKGDDGERRFNWDSLVAPVGLAFHEVAAKEDLIRVMIPYRYAVLFNKAELLDQADREKVSAYVQGELAAQMVEMQLRGLDWKPEAWQTSREAGPWSVGATTPPVTDRISDVTLLGTASPEGPEYKGSGTVAIGAIDRENLGLAIKRANNLRPTIEQALKETFDDPALLEQMTKQMQVEGKELQFSEAELVTLEKMAGQLGHHGEGLEKVFDLIVDYNDNKISDPKVKQALDTIVGAKRMVVLSFRKESGQIDTMLIPLPLIALLAVRRRRRTAPVGTERVPTPTPAPELVPTPPDFNDRVRRVLQRDQELNEIDPTYRLWRETVRPQTVHNDLLPNWDNPEIRARGLDYDQICRDIAAFPRDSETDQARLDALTYRLLNAWRSHDLRVRQEAGVTDETGLDYLDDERQILWARVHAEVLDQAIAAKQAHDLARVQNPELPQRSYADFLVENEG